MSKKISRDNWPDSLEKGLIETKNKMGIMTTELSYPAKAFSEFAKTTSGHLLDIGAAYGAATYAALEQGGTVTAIDLSQEQLDILAKNIPDCYQGKLNTMQAAFPHDLHFTKASIAGILISQVLHFLSGEDIDTGLAQCFDWLVSGGKLFLLSMTPYLAFYKEFLPAYLQRVDNNETWPGIFSPKDCNAGDWVDRLPDMVNLCDIPVLKAAVERAGFMIEYCDYYSFPSYPAEYRDTGKEYVAIIAVKI